MFTEEFKTAALNLAAAAIAFRELVPGCQTAEVRMSRGVTVVAADEVGRTIVTAHHADYT